jgi:phosphate starvation-inducible PhoH-like protein
LSELLNPAEEPLVMRFDDNALLPQLFGEHDQHLARIEQEIGVIVNPRGNLLVISGPADSVVTAEAVLSNLYEQLRQGAALRPGDVEGVIRLALSADARAQRTGDRLIPDLIIRTGRHRIKPRSATQAAYIRALGEFEFVISVGPAGTGKTYLAVAMAASMLNAGKVDRIILSRPAVEAGERLGFLPGDVKEKVDPYLRPLYDALHDMMPGEKIAKKLETGEIEIAPLAFMRGRTLSNAFVILDEAQNTTPVQMKMFLTRLGENSRMVVTGDLSQVDLPPGASCGLKEAIGVLGEMEGMTLVRFADADVVRNPLVTRIVRAYDSFERENTKRTGSKAPGTGS